MRTSSSRTGAIKTLHRLAFFSLLIAAATGCTRNQTWDPPAATLPGGSVVVLGVDGLDRLLLERLVNKGDLPAFARVMREGMVADMHVGRPLISPRIWTSLASGYAAEVHGIKDWVKPNRNPYRATDVAVERIWDAASRAGKRVLVSGWLMTTPVSKVKGVMLSDEIVLRGSMDMNTRFKPRRDPAVLDGWLAWPLSALEQVEKWVPGKEWLKAHALGYQVSEYGAAVHPLARDETHIRSLEMLGPSLKADLSLVYLSGADQLSHQFWPFADPKAVAAMRADPGLRSRSAAGLEKIHPGRRRVPLSGAPTTQKDLDEGGRWIPDYYRYLDSLLARVLQRIPANGGTLILCSDHGFSAADEPVALHRDPALLIGWGARVRKGANPKDRVTVLDLAPTLYAMLGVPAAQDMPGRVLDDLFEVTLLPPVASRVRSVAGAVPGAPSDHPRRKMLESLGYINEQGNAIPRPKQPK